MWLRGSTDGTYLTRDYSRCMTWCLPFFLVEGHIRVAKVTVAHAILAVERLAELMAHGTRFGVTIPLMVVFLASKHAAIFAGPAGCHSGGGHGCRRCSPWSLERSARVNSIWSGSGSVHRPLRSNWHDDDGDRQQ